ncbi:MAG: MoxR family ATPase [bacterium]|nr:MoxR family ATPase [bacterium]
MTNANPEPTSPLGSQAGFASTFEAIAANVERVVKGKRRLVRLLLLCLFAEGHVLLRDPPGAGKTVLAKTVARTLGLEFGRVQFTPDLMPSDVVGVSLWNPVQNGFEFRPGPVFAGLLLADEINRTSPRTQAALLEAMAERQVTVDGTTHGLASPFLVIATENSQETEGTFPLPTSQLDRFGMSLSAGFPDRAAESEILESHRRGTPLDSLPPVTDTATVRAMIDAVRSVHVAPAVRDYLVDLALSSRAHSAISGGMSPRATLGLQRTAQARAAAAGRSFVLPDDVKEVARPILAHRLTLEQSAQFAGTTPAAVIDEILADTPAPPVSVR